MKGFSVEPGERTVLVMSIQPERLASKKSDEPTSPRISPVRASASTMATDSFGPELLGGLLGDRLQPCLDLPADGELVDMLGRCIPHARPRRHARQAPAAPGARRTTSSPAARSRFVLVDQAGAHHALEHAVARGVRTGEVAVRPAALRQLRQRDEQCRFRQRQALRLLAEIGERGSADAFEIAAIGGERQIGFQDLALAHAPLDLHGAQDLPDLGAERAALARLHQAGELHRQRRAARDDAAVAGELAGGAQQRQHVDALMVPEALVLVGDQHAHELRVDRVDVGGEPPAAVRRGEGAQQLAVAVDDLGRDREGRSDRRRVGAVGPFQAAPGQRDEGRCGGETMLMRRAICGKAWRCPSSACRTFWAIATLWT